MPSDFSTHDIHHFVICIPKGFVVQLNFCKLVLIDFTFEATFRKTNFPIPQCSIVFINNIDDTVGPKKENPVSQSIVLNFRLGKPPSS